MISPAMMNLNTGDNRVGRWSRVKISALGQKRTYAVQKGMSALPPIATEKADIRTRSCPLYPQKRTCAVQVGMSALGQKRTLGFTDQGAQPKSKTPDRPTLEYCRAQRHL